MQYSCLGGTLNISRLCLGTMVFGEQLDQDQSFHLMDRAVESGVNFFDVAEMYSIPPRAETYGRSEEIIGNWLKARGNRDQMIIASKIAGPSSGMKYIRKGKNCLDRANIEQAIAGSLKRLQTDYIDLYQLHWPDRQTNYFGRLGYEHPEPDNSVPLEETLSAMNDLVNAGKVRCIGVSNETPWGVMRFLQ
jgi:aryl-alcohol dehydrogenase-like predicted oxidoreductase